MYRKSKKLLVWLLVLSMVLTQMIFTSTAFAAGSSRLSGLNRYETALKVSQTGWTAGSTEYAVLAYGEDFPDALSAAPLAKKYNAPILLTDKAALSAGVLEEINRVGAKNVFIVGGEGVVSKAVADALTAAGKTVTRLAGASRYETSLKVAEQVGTTDTVVVAYGENYPDALSIAPVAAAKGWPILLTGTNSMDAAVKAYIGSKKAFVVGGVGAVSDAVFNGLSGAERVFGADRYATNVAVMTKFAAELSFNKVFLATGENFADALAGAAYAAKLNAPVVLVGASLAAATESFVDSKVTSATEVIALGGTSVVPESAVTAIGGGTQDLAISAIAVTTQDGRNFRMTFNRPVAPLKKSDFTIVQKNSQTAIGVDTVEMSSDNMSAEVTLLEESDLNTTTIGYIQELETYTFTVRAEGRTLTTDYTRPAYREARVVEVDAKDRIITVDTSLNGDDIDYKVPADVVMDFQDVLGRKLSVWLNADREITKFNVWQETVKYDAVEIFPAATSDQIQLKTEDKKYDAAAQQTSNSFVVNGVLDMTKGFQMYVDKDSHYTSVANVPAQKIDYAKIVFDKNGDVCFVSSYNFNDVLVVEKTEGNIAYGYKQELKLEDWAIEKDGKSVTIADLKQGDILFYNTTEEFAEVFNKSVNGDIEQIFTDRITVAGKDYTVAVDNFGINAKYINEDNELKALPTDPDDLKDIAEAYQDAGKVTVFLNRYNKMVYLTGDITALAKTTSYDLVTDQTTRYQSRNDWFYSFDVMNSAGEEVAYDINETDVDNANDEFVYDANGNATTWATAAVAWKEVVQVKVDKDGEVAQVRKLTPVTIPNQFETKDSYVGGFKIAGSTPVYLLENYTGTVATADEDDIEVTTYDKLAFDYINQGTAYVKDGEVKAIVVVQSDRKDDATDYITMSTDKIYTVNSDKAQFKLPVVINGAKVSLFTDEKVPVYNLGAEVKNQDELSVTAVQNAINAKGTMLKVSVDDNNVITKIVIIANDETAVANWTTAGIISEIKTGDREIGLDLDAAFGDADNTLATNETIKLGTAPVYYDKADGKVIALTDLKVGERIFAARVAFNSQYVDVIYRVNKK